MGPAAYSVIWCSKEETLPLPPPPPPRDPSEGSPDGLEPSYISNELRSLVSAWVCAWEWAIGVAAEQHLNQAIHARKNRKYGVFEIKQLETSSVRGDTARARLNCA